MAVVPRPPIVLRPPMWALLTVLGIAATAAWWGLDRLNESRDETIRTWAWVSLVIGAVFTGWSALVLIWLGLFYALAYRAKQYLAGNLKDARDSDPIFLIMDDMKSPSSLPGATADLFVRDLYFEHAKQARDFHPDNEDDLFKDPDGTIQGTREQACSLLLKKVGPDASSAFRRDTAKHVVRGWKRGYLTARARAWIYFRTTTNYIPRFARRFKVMWKDGEWGNLGVARKHEEEEPG
jgi:hypothetical protein